MKDLEQSPDFEKLDIYAPDMLRQFNKLKLFLQGKTRDYVSSYTQGKTANQQLRLMGKKVDAVP